MSAPLIDKPLQRVLSGFIRMHVLHHADEGDLCGNWMIEELRHHGYKISAGTLYPMLRTMEKDGWITGRNEKGGGRRRLYNITPKWKGSGGAFRQASRHAWPLPWCSILAPRRC